jgi:hypothetical protein
MKKGSLGMSSISKQAPQMDSLMHKFNNSLAIQNMAGYGGSSSIVGGIIGSGSKSRNIHTGTFKTTASIGSTKAAGKSLISP